MWGGQLNLEGFFRWLKNNLKVVLKFYESKSYTKVVHKVRKLTC